MLDAETKRRIDSCRDILVGKVPDPKSQVEQITIALIYKFMDDMDAEAEELGGKRSFFAGEFAKYGWAKLMAPNMGGFDVLALYSEAIGKMTENPGIPPLFRDIFKNAYLPYRDPETLRSFLKEINVFTYDHSEKLGDAFEYLLSVLGSQGDAGQFRTPRHIIDFMVELIDPQKGERILDPACGTAGFLISAWKHILKQNTTQLPSPTGGGWSEAEGGGTLVRAGDQLTPDQRAYIAANVHGYDISPDMVRLSLVNLYLHGFSDPHIVEYDTLTSEEKWNDYADVILANPPFMSPKGGIKPHKRFSIQASRSEVLFVDYIAEHLSPNGRAAIIVPEGIIFQSGTAYKQLRQMLVKNSLATVISLPAGVFNPYSGVKTSILILDKWLAKRSDDVLFIKVENDGFNLGAQRRAMAGSGLPDALAAYQTYRHSREGGNPVAFDAAQFGNALAVEKTRLGESGEWNLSGERYQINAQALTTYEVVQIGDVISTITPPMKLQKESYSVDGRYPIIDQSQQEIAGWSDDELAIVRPPKPLVIFGDHTCSVKLVKQPFVQGADGIKIIETSDSLLPAFLFNFLKVNPLETDGYKRHFTDLKRKTIPLPPLAIQQEIVAEIEGYQKIIVGARQVVENYQPRINVQPDWPMVELGKVCEKIMDGTHFSPSNTETGARLYITSKNVRENYLDLSNISYISEEDHREIFSRCSVKSGDVLYIKDGANTGLAAINTLTEEFSLLSSVAVLRGKPDALDNRYLALYLNTEHGRKNMLSMISGVAITRLTLTKLNAAIIPLPDLETQRAIVAEIEAEQALVYASKQLIIRFEAKIKTTINSVWGGEVSE